MNQLEKLAAELKDVTPYLLSGGAGALATGLALSKMKRDPKKSRMADLAKRLAIVLGGGAVAAGAHKALNVGLDSLATALPKEDVATEEKITSVVGNPNTVRALATGGTGAALYGMGRRADNLDIRALFGNKNIGSNPTEYVKSLIASQPNQGNKLESFLDVHDSGDQVKPKALSSLEAKITELKNDLKQVKNDPALNQQLTDELNAAKQQLKITEADVKNTVRAGNKSQLARAGFNAADYPDTLLNKIKQQGRIHGGRLVGRSGAARVLKPAALIAALASPEIISGGASLLNSPNPSSDVPE